MQSMLLRYVQIRLINQPSYKKLWFPVKHKKKIWVNRKPIAFYTLVD